MQNSQNSRKCFECGSDLILVEETQHLIGNNPAPIYKSVYRCSNQSCQEATETKLAKKAQLRQEQELARANRRKQSTPLVIKVV